jgi:hypothetical protein
MDDSSNRCELVSGLNVREFFQQSVTAALSNQRITVAGETIHYIVNLLDSFTRSEMLYEQTDDGIVLRPLAEFYLEAVEAPSPESRDAALRRLGDVALFVAGLFSDSLNRRIVDIDYYIAMGGNAYGYLSERSQRAARHAVFAHVFAELAAKFTALVDVLAEVGEQSGSQSDIDTLRTYEVWLRTGSKRAARLLRAEGIEPVGAGMLVQH